MIMIHATQRPLSALRKLQWPAAFQVKLPFTYPEGELKMPEMEETARIRREFRKALRLVKLHEGVLLIARKMPFALSVRKMPVFALFCGVPL